MAYRRLRPDNSINLLARGDNLFPKGKKVFRVSKFIIYLLVMVVIVSVFFSSQVMFSSDSSTDSNRGWGFFKQLSWPTAGKTLKGEKNDRINILLLGMGGLKHDGPYLTDTVMLASLKPSTNQLAFISIPRDLLVNIPKQGWWKINIANHFGEQKKKNSGAELTTEIVENITGLKIPYYVRVDFEAFEQIIDEVGGVKIHVDHGFTDPLYPTLDHKYQVISFQHGWQTMDGDTALKFVRSRHGNNGEGSDFARSLRQQKLLSAMKKRLFSYQMLFKPHKVSKILRTLDKHILTNLKTSEFLKLIQLGKNINADNFIHHVLNDAPDNLLYAGVVNEAYVLQPRAGDWADVRELANKIFDVKYKVVASKPLPEPELEADLPLKEESVVETAETQNFASVQQENISAKVEIRNGTLINGLASRTSDKLKKQNFEIVQLGNAPTQEFQTGVIYLLNPEKQSAFDKIKNILPLENQPMPDAVLQEILSPQADILIILGQNNSDLEL